MAKKTKKTEVEEPQIQEKEMAVKTAPVVEQPKEEPQLKSFSSNHKVACLKVDSNE